MRACLLKIVKWTAIIATACLLTFLGVRIYDTQRGLPLELWHTYVPEEMSIADLDRGGWGDYLKAEDAAFAGVRAEVTERLDASERVPVNRYFDGSPVYPGHFAQDWNRSYELRPDGPPKGVAVFLHGLTDSPYSLRHIARRYRDQGFVAVAIRLPGHGTVPGGLTDVTWEEWLAATRLAVREARQQVPAPLPLHIVGFSNGGALAMMYAMEALEDKQLARPDRLILISPMVGITAFARFAGVAGWPAFFPAFAKAAWLSILPEFNPFKYNSFPVNGARQSFQLTQALQAKIVRHEREDRLAGLPPVMTFQSVLDFTVSTRAVIRALYNRLPDNGSELVLFDLNRGTKIGLLFSTRATTAVNRLLPPAPRRYGTTIVTNAGPDTGAMVARVTPAGATSEETRDLGFSYPLGVFSLSHVALPFPVSDELYGLQPDSTEEFGIQLGNIAARGERGSLIVNLDSLLRMSSNPFYPYLLSRVEAAMAPAPAP
ncbi:alpha/beta hydrolase [Ancylobacter terrae]|uniref:alpha/beta hydrolase n=1 Tax=Ancylobacter sp. sgz301288 TaxID=3342077 RepID=UPI00385BF312